MSFPLTVEQEAVVAHRHGTASSSAVPGSGKTRTLVERTRRLLSADDKLVLAFNKRAAEEFAQRLGSAPGADVRTFHSFCYREIMRRPTHYGFSGKPSVITGGIFMPLLKATGTESKYWGWDESPWDEDTVTRCESEVYDDALDELAERDPEFSASYTAVKALRAWMLRTNNITFDAMVRLVAQKRDELQPRVDHIMVDEYQDVDQFQFDIVAAMGPKVESLVVVGDPNQRIYEWRGALMSAFTDFHSQFPTAISLPMTKNFRSMDGILRLAEESCPVGMTGVRGDDTKSVVEAYATPQVTDMQLLLEPPSSGGMPWQDRAVLCRYNRECAFMQMQLARAGIPVNLIGKSDFWSMKHVMMACEARSRKESASMLFQRMEWRRYSKRGRFKGEQGERLLAEQTADVSWLIGLSDADYTLLRDCIQNPDGVQISTIHKAKGREWRWVHLVGATEKLKAETYVWYVAITRAMDRLILG